ncbi:MAG: glycosyltransferase [Ignavibacteriales bacterium]|nr:glycosyltransferase [Ignavibacteriales bacterium]MCF8435908.1 glycosyltransferase [Ignavibacteriales bacterium]
MYSNILLNTKSDIENTNEQRNSFKMKIIINTAHQRFGGAIQVALSFIYECRNFPENEYHVFLGHGVRKSLKESDFPENFTFYPFDFGILKFSTTFKLNKILSALEKRIKPDCVISTSGPTYFHSNAPQIIGYNLPLYIYNESPFVQDLSLRKKFRLWIRKKVHFYYFKRDARAFTTQTDDVNLRVKKALKTDQVFTVTNTANGYYNDWKKFPDKLPPKQDNELRFLTISAYYKHKDLEIIPRVTKILRSNGIRNVKFVLTLDPVDFQKYIGNDEDILNVGPVKPEECPSLYNETDFMFLPTLAECFSASYPEAMIMQKPILTTDLGFARSICGEAALYYKPRNAADAAEKIMKLINDDTLRRNLIKSGTKQLEIFDTPLSRAEKYLKLCRDVLVTNVNK